MNIILNSALHVPDLWTNLLFEGKITNSGYEVLFKMDNALICDMKGGIKLIANRVGDFYFTRETEQESTDYTDPVFVTQKLAT